MSVTRAIFRPIYAGCDALSKLRELPGSFGVDATSHVVYAGLRVFRAAAQAHTPALDQSIHFLRFAQDFNSKVIAVPKTWDDFMKAMKDIPTSVAGFQQISKVKSLQVVSALTGGIAKTIGFVEYMDKLGVTNIPYEIPYLGTIAAQVGGSKLFSTTLSQVCKIRAIKTPLSQFTCVVRIIISIATCCNDWNRALIVAQPGQELTPAQKQENNRITFAGRNCIFKCAAEVSKLVFISAGASATPLLLAFDVFSGVLHISAALFEIYWIQENAVRYPTWLIA